jgi:hypothetical protein
MSRHTTITVILGVALLAVATTACGVPTGEDTYEAIPPDEILFELDATSTSTTTSTTTLPDVPASTLPPTTSTPIRLEPAEIYFLSRGRLQPVVVELPPGASPDQIADVLELGPPQDVALETLIEEGLIVSAVDSRGVLTVDLDAETFDRIPSTQQTEAIGQIVLTMLRSLRGVGLVTFTLGGEPIPVKKGNGLSSEVGESLSFDDYTVLLASPRTTTDTTAPTTTATPATTSTTATTAGQ